MGKYLSNLTWPKAKETFEDTKLALVPIGSIEQHGPHMPLETDAIIAEEFAKRTSDDLDCIVTPLIPVGYADYHSDFEGTLSVPENILKEYVKSLISYLLKYGVTHVLIINGHGGNTNSLMKAAGELRKDENAVIAIAQWWEIAEHLNKEWAVVGHGDFVETSIVLAIDPENVDIEKAKMPVNKYLSDKIHTQELNMVKFEKGYIHMNLRSKDISETGDLIEYGHSSILTEKSDFEDAKSPADAKAEVGEEVLNEVSDYFKRAAEELTKVELDEV